MLLDIEVAEQGGMAAVNLDHVCAATGMKRPALLVALDQLMAAGFVVVSVDDRDCTVTPSTRWRT
jgi:hypothetical protein